jgi:hypothetical protein
VIDRIARVALVALEIFLAVTAIYGAIYVVPIQPRGLLAGSPFTDYTIPALGLGLLVGGGALAAAAFLGVRPRVGALLSVASGGSIIVFELVETSVMGFDVWRHAIGLGPAVTFEKYGSLEGIPVPLGVPLPLWLQPFYLVVGLLIVALALRLWTATPRRGTTLRPSVGGWHPRAASLG